jgi:hypothetical protein
VVTGLEGYCIPTLYCTMGSLYMGNGGATSNPAAMPPLLHVSIWRRAHSRRSTEFTIPPYNTSFDLVSQTRSNVQTVTAFTRFTRSRIISCSRLVAVRPQCIGSIRAASRSRAFNSMLEGSRHASIASRSKTRTHVRANAPLTSRSNRRLLVCDGSSCGSQPLGLIGRYTSSQHCVVGSCAISKLQPK